MTTVRLITAVVATTVSLGLLARATAVPVPWHSENRSQLRLSWRARPERIEVCRIPSAEELAQTAEHMRQRLICEGTSASYRLQVVVDGEMIDSQVVRGGGLRHDRPLQVFLDYPLAVGSHQLRVTLDRQETPAAETSAEEDNDFEESESGTFAGRAGREVTERVRGRQAAIPASLVLDTVIEAPAHTVILVTFDPDTRTLGIARPKEQ